MMDDDEDAIIVSSDDDVASTAGRNQKFFTDFRNMTTMI
jgi:hypothetical protein